MTDPSLRTTQIQGWVDRIQRGDRAARDELLRQVCGRLERLARTMLHHYPRLKRWVEAEDVLQGALLRLMRALEQVRPESSRSFLDLAATQIRRELLDLGKHFFGPHGQAAHHISKGPDDSSNPGQQEPVDQAEDHEELERWCAFHEAVEGLQAEQREVVSLIYYHGWTRAEVAGLLQVDEKTVRRRWRAALLALHARLGEVGAGVGGLPES